MCEVDITDAKRIELNETISASTGNIGASGNSVSPNTKAGPPSDTSRSSRATAVDEDALSTILVNCIRNTNTLLSKGSSKQLLARSKEIGQLMEDVLIANANFPPVPETPRSLSDLIDSSAWRPL